MPFRARFDCLWCGTPHETRGPDDLEGWAQLCPTCVGRAGENEFLRFRVKAALAERAAAKQPTTGGAALAPEARAAAAPTPSSPAGAAAAGAPALGAAGKPAATERGGTRDDELVAYYEARAPEYDDWYLRRGRYDRGPIANAVWQADLDAATLWLDRLPLGGRIVELAAGTGWWSPLLAGKGELWAFDASGAALDLARRRLQAHRLRAHLHVRDAWAEPDEPADAVFAGFWLSHVERSALPAFLALVRRWLRPGGRFAFVDSRLDEESRAVDHPAPDTVRDRSVRRLADGRTFEITKVHYAPAELASALAAAGFVDVSVTTTSRFFVLGLASAPG